MKVIVKKVSTKEKMTMMKKTLTTALLVTGLAAPGLAHADWQKVVVDLTGLSDQSTTKTIRPKKPDFEE